MVRPVGEITWQFSRSTVIRALPGEAFISSASCSISWIGRATGKRPFWKQLLLKMSPKYGAITALMPMPFSAHTAPSRLEPQPKFSRLRMIGASR